VSRPAILGERVEYRSPWLDVKVKEVDLGPPRGREEFWSVGTGHDYVAVLATTEDGLVPLVRLFRPAVDEVVLELPSGAIDRGETPEEAIRRELLEETGCEANEVVSLGTYFTDSGRMETLQWAFFAPRVRAGVAEPHEDEGLELLFVERAELRESVLRGEFRMAPHLAIIGAAVLHGRIEL
jgi:ADP-ribose pyrophosphatase